MSATTLATAQTMLGLYVAAETAVLSNQEYQIGDRRLKRADLAEIRAGRAEWQAMVDRLSAGASRRSRTRYVVPQ